MANLDKKLPAIALILAIGGFFPAFIAVPVVRFNWYLADHAASYRATSFVIQKVEYWRQARRRYHVATVEIDGRIDKVPLDEFGDTPHSQTALEQNFPAGSRYYVFYNPDAPDRMVTGTSLRILPDTYPIKRAGRRAALQALWLVPFVTGCCLQFYVIRTQKRRDREELENHLIQIKHPRSR